MNDTTDAAPRRHVHVLKMRQLRTDGSFMPSGTSVGPNSLFPMTYYLQVCDCGFPYREQDHAKDPFSP